MKSTSSYSRSVSRGSTTSHTPGYGSLETYSATRTLPTVRRPIRPPMISNSVPFTDQQMTAVFITDAKYGARPAAGTRCD